MGGNVNTCVCAVVSRIDSFMKYTLKLEKNFFTDGKKRLLVMHAFWQGLDF